MESLPDELLLRCLARVPPSEAGPGCFRLRSVCRKWRQLLASEMYDKLRRDLGLASDWLLTLTERLEGGLLCKLFDPITNRCQRFRCTWDDLDPSRMDFNYASSGRLVYAMGGFKSTPSKRGWGPRDTTFIDALQSYDPVLNIVKNLAPMKVARGSFGCCLGDGKIFVLGGRGAEGVLKSAEVYDIKTDTWEILPDLPEGRAWFSAEYINGKVFVVGGSVLFGKSRLMPAALAVWTYDCRARKWSKDVAHLPAPRQVAETAVLNGRLCVIGGTTDGHNVVDSEMACFKTPLIYDESSNEWKIWKTGRAYQELRSVEGVEHRIHCDHESCENFNSRPFVCVTMNDELFLVRRCDNGLNGYCRHIHRFRPDMATASFGAGWDCVLRDTMYSALLLEAGDCWEHSVATVLKY